MIQIGSTVVSFEIFERKFLCQIADCKGICCVEGDSGAPLEDDEIPQLEAVKEIVFDELPKTSQQVIENQGVWYRDQEGDKVTSIVNGRECVFAVQENGVWKCAIERAFRQGRTAFYKPISCHLYPIRLTKYRDFTAVNLHRWEVCKMAEICGENQNLPAYKFLKEPLIRQFGEKWYAELLAAAELYNNYKKQKNERV